MELNILGPLEVLDERGARVEIPRGRARSLLALLILHAGEVVAAERLIDELWGAAPPSTAPASLQNLIATLRRQLEPDTAARDARVLRTQQPGYVLEVDPERIDARRFRRALEAARDAAPDDRVTLLRDALSLWRGGALDDVAYEPFAQAEIASLQELRTVAREELVEAELALGRATEMLEEIESLVEAHPFRERPRALQMLALYRAGRQADALEAYRTTRQTLLDELGIDPGSVLQELEQAILRQDASLDAPAQPAHARAWFEQERRAVTVVFVGVSAPDVADPEARSAASAAARAAAGEVLRRHGATVRAGIGELLIGWFGTPVAHEDDVLRALRAALEIKRPGITIGIDAGEVLFEADGAIIGEAVTRAAELQRACPDGDALAGRGARALAGDAASFEPVDDAWRPVVVPPPAPAVRRRLDAPMFGREEQLARFRSLFEQVGRNGSPFRLLVSGEPGLGKSRLTAESVREQAGTLMGHCPPYGDGVTFRPLREALAGSLGDDEVSRRVAGAVGITPTPPPPPELFPSFKAFFDDVTARGPVALVLDDVHWAEETLLDLIDYLTDAVEGPLLIVCLARPEVLERRPAWSEGGRARDVLALEPLDEPAVRALIADRLGGLVMPDDQVTRVIEAAQGNPLFVEQMIESFRGSGSPEVPATLHALLASRIDRLRPAERDLLRCASVVGARFSTGALAALVPGEARVHLDGHLRALTDRRFIEHDAEGMRFAHALVRDAAHRSLTRRDRARLHLRFADWLEHEADPVPADLSELVASHLERTLREQRALGSTDEGLGARAGEHLVAAASGAYLRFDIPAVESFLERAMSLLPAGHERRADASRMLIEIYPVLGRGERAEQLLDEIADEDDAALDLERARVRAFLGPDPVSFDTIIERAERALAIFEAAGDEGAAAKAWYVIGYARYRLGDIDGLIDAGRRGVTLADRAGHGREELASRWSVALGLRYGTTPLEDAIPACEQLARWRDELHPGVLSELAALLALRGDVEEARATLARARRIVVERMRTPRPLLHLAMSSAAIESLGGDVPAAERELRLALRMATQMAEQHNVTLTAARLALSLASSHADEAARLAALADEHAPTEGWTRAAALVARAATGDADSDALAREAVTIAPTSMPAYRAEILAVAAALLGDGYLLTEAEQLHAAKGVETRLVTP